MKVKSVTYLAVILSMALAPQLTMAAHIVQHNLVSDVPGLADAVDASLVNPWGITRGPATPWWASDNGKSVSTLYTGAGVKLGLTVAIPPSGSSPTGTVFNGTADFKVAGNPSRFIFVTQQGTIAAWAPANGTNAVTMVDHSGSAVYTGVTLGQQGADNRLYAANFLGGVEVYDGAFQPVTLSAGAFTDSALPPGYAPFNVQNIDGRIWVSFALREPGGEDEVAGKGLGHVDAFDTSGHLIMRLRHGKWMNAPWGLAQAPANFGKWSHRILVGQFGSGRIATFDASNGEFKGLLRGEHGKPIAIEGLWGIMFGNDGAAGPSNTLFFSAGIEDEAHGLFGTLVPNKLKNHDKDDDDDHDEDEDE
jgi:uncharacterized protein (TIGR03118 family)